MPKTRRRTGDPAVYEAMSVVLDQLDRSVFLVRADRLTPVNGATSGRRQSWGPGPHRSGDIASMLGVKVESIAPRRSS
jgi:hypothetical protein